MQHLTKSAAQDQEFEQGFFQLAFDKLQSKLFNLMPYFVGFELVRKSENGDKAVGVFAFKSANGQILFVPAFFIDGKVKELDTLYSRNNNQFYPLNEDFAELFMKDDVTGIGSVSPMNRNDLTKDMPPLDFRDLSVPPRTGRQVIASVLDYVEGEGNQTKQAFWELMEKNADFTEAVRRFYPDEKIAKALVRNDAPVAKKITKVKAYKNVKDLDPNASVDLKKKIMDRGYTIIDHREPEEKSKFGIIDMAGKFTNPTDSGFYTYITETGALRYGLIFTRPTQLNQGFSTNNTIVIDLESDTPGLTFVTNQPVFIKDQIRVQDYSAAHKMMEEPAEGLPSFSNVYILVNDNLKASVPFRIIENFKENDGIRRLKIEPDWSCGCELPPRSNSAKLDGFPGEVTLMFTKKGGDKLDFRGKFVYVPKGFKLLHIKPRYDDFSAGYDPTPEGQKKQRDEKAWLRRSKPGTVTHVTELLQEKFVYPMTVHTNGSDYFLTIKDAKKQYDSPVTAKIAMVCDLGMDEAAANDLIDHLIPDITVSGHLKLAYTGDQVLPLQDEAPGADDFGTPTYYGIPYQQMADRSDGYTGNPTAKGLAESDPNPQNQGMASGASSQGQGKKPFNINDEVQNAVSMANSGQKEIFDTQAIATLAKYTDPSSKALSYIPNFVSTMDKLGRMLFMIYWDTEKFQEMYGKDELPELIEMLKSVFKNIGDLVIFMKRKFPDISINNDDQATDQI